MNSTQERTWWHRWESGQGWGFPTVGTGNIVVRSGPGVVSKTSLSERDTVTYDDGIAPLGLLEEWAGTHHRDAHIVGTKACPCYGEDAHQGQGPARDMQVSLENTTCPW